MQLRKAAEKDLDSIIKMYEEAKKALCARGIYQWDEIYPDKKILSEDVRSGQMYVLDWGEDIAAGLVLNGQYDPLYLTADWRYHDRPFAVIHRLCVNPVHQSRGIGSAAVREAERVAAKGGIGAIRLDAFTENQRSLRLYEQLGYRKAGTVRFRKGLFFLYEKKLDAPEA
jgi:ribosomal protein S18 acetylase RimI-like enzyme